jgi:hypothetical protein
VGHVAAQPAIAGDVATSTNASRVPSAQPIVSAEKPIRPHPAVIPSISTSRTSTSVPLSRGSREVAAHA